MRKENTPYYSDLLRFGKQKTTHGMKFIKAFRIYNSDCFIVKRIIARIKMKILSNFYGLEIPPDVKIGKGFYIGHGYNITINPNAILGSNVNIHKGVTIGQENRGKRKGSPQVGNMVWIGVNATIVGKVKIGNNVLIAPNSYVNCDVPDNSIVLGNPCKIVPCEKATENYICNMC